MATCNQDVTTRLLTYRQAAREYGLTVWGLRTLVWERKLPVVKLHAHKHLFDRRDLDRLVAESKGMI